MRNAAQPRFLAAHDLRPLTWEPPKGLRPVGLALGQGSRALEVVVTEAKQRPALTTLRAAWRDRQGGRAVPLLVVALYDGRAALCGPIGDDPPAYAELDRGLVERLCTTALGEPDRHAALRLLRDAIPEIESPLPGIRNEGFLATHELRVGVPQRADWAGATERGRGALAHRDRGLLEALGFQVQDLPGPASLLFAGEERRAVAIFLDRSEAVEVGSDRFSGISPISYALSHADRENVPYVVVTRGPTMRLYPVRPGVGTGRRGRTETYVEVHLDLLADDRAGYLWLLFSAGALARGGTLEDVLDRSGDYAAELGGRLRDRVYERVVPDLATALFQARRLLSPTADDLRLTYEMALALLFRLLFVSYAEDTERLPYRTNGLYRQRSLKEKAKELNRILDEDIAFDEGTSHWDEVNRLFRAVADGHREWGVPTYNGQLFASEEEVFPVGALLEQVTLPNDVIGPILSELLLDETPEGRGPVDFRDLGVREFGTIYEGLLENELAVAEADLTVDKDGRYCPAGESDEVAVGAGQAYLHDASGARKATGSYYTKHFAVEHLLDHALEPALDDHLARLGDLDDRHAGEAFFDFRVADIAMGSGHFLIAAVDRIERRFSSYLAEHPLPVVADELARLRASALEALGDLGQPDDIEDTQLLRRQIARRCIYGADLNSIAVQLARLSLWIHTFVPGLPLSFLDRTLVCGNSLVGMASIEEMGELLKSLSGSLAGVTAEKLLGDAKAAVDRLARMSDADAAEIRRARKAYRDAEAAATPARALMNILAATRVDEEVRGEVASMRVLDWDDDLPGLPESGIHRNSEQALRTIPAFHFPIAFPEVFLRDRPGFDVIIGNPPWEEATVEEDRFWNRHFPGLQSLSQREQEATKSSHRRERPDLAEAFELEREKASLQRAALVAGPFPGMGTGDPDLYKAFCWRFWHLAHTGGRIGVVLPRSAWCARGSGEFRKAALAEGAEGDLTFLVNRGGWVFHDAEHRYTIALSGVAKGSRGEEGEVSLRGPYASRHSFDIGIKRDPGRFSGTEVRRWTDTAALPLLPGEESAEVFKQLRRSPRLDLEDGTSWRARPHTELHATNDKKLMDLTSKERPEGFWPVYKGESFDLWQPDTGAYYAWAEPDLLKQHLQDKRVRSARNRRSAFSEFPNAWLQDENTLPCLRVRIAFHDVARSTDTRTVKVALVPPAVFITNAAPYLLWPRGDERDQAYLLGVLASIPLDWYARRFVELHLNYHVFNPFPVPRASRGNALWQRTVALAGRLACPDGRFAEWAEAVGVECGALPEDEKQDMIHELDAVVAHLYGLTEAHLRHIFETFHEGWDYEERLGATLVHFRRWRERL